MSRVFETAARAFVLLVMISAFLAVGFFPAYLAGFAWGVIAVVVVGAMVARMSRGGIDGAYASVLCLVLLAIGFIASLLVRWGQVWLG